MENDNLSAQRVYPDTAAGPGMVWMGNKDNTAWKQVPTGMVGEGRSLGYRVVQPKPKTSGNPNQRWDRGLFAQPGQAEVRAGQEASGRLLPQVVKGLAEMEGKQLPLQAAIVAAAAFPGAGPLAWLQRMTAAGGAALPASVAGQAMQGDMPTVQQTQNDVLTNTGLQGFGEGLAGAARLTARGLAGLATRVTPRMAEQFPGINLADELLARNVGSPAEATAAREASAREARKQAVTASRKKTIKFSPTSIPEKTNMLVPGVVSSTESFTIPPTAGITDLAAASARETAARSHLHRIATKAGYEDEELISLLSQQSPRPIDLAQARRRGLDAKDLQEAREYMGTIGAESAAREAASPQQALSTKNNVVFSPTTGMVAPREPNALRPEVGRQFEYTPDQFANSPEIRALRNKLRNSSEPTVAADELDAFLQRWAAEHGGRKTPIDWYRLAQNLQRESKPFYGRGAQGIGQQVASSPTEQSAKAALAGAIKRAIGKDVPAVRTADTDTKVLIALERALKRNDTIVQKGGGLAGAAAADVLTRRLGHAGMGTEVPAALLGAYLGHTASSPTVLANTALTLNSPSIQAALANNPKLLFNLLRSGQIMPDGVGK